MNEDGLVQAFSRRLQAFSVGKEQLLLLAVSGGVDSVVLCDLCHRAGYRFFIAHCNFGLRGEESLRDADFVRSLGRRYGVDVAVKSFDTAGYAAAEKLSVQEAARALRYPWFEALRREKGAAFTVLAHHANDNLETVLMHFFRGTGLQGLTGMPDAAGGTHLLRPLLPVRRKSIEAFARAHELAWVEDSSNRSDKYTRNYFRNTLLPAIEKVYPEAEENVLDNIERFKKVDAFYRLSVHQALHKLVQATGPENRIPIRLLQQYTATSIPFELLKRYGFGEKQVPQLLQLAESPSGRYMENESWRIIRHHRWLIFSPRGLPEPATAVIEAGTKKVALPGCLLALRTVDKAHFTLQRSPEVAQLDAATLQYPLLVRRWKPGDYFYPLGMRKKKKLARFFIDLKLSLPEKEKVWVVESDRRIVWVVGHRIDDRFKVAPNTSTVVQISLSSLSPAGSIPPP